MYLRDLSLQRAAANVVAGEQWLSGCDRAGYPPIAVHVIPNWSNDEELCPLGRDQNPLRTGWGLDRDFVVGIFGKPSAALMSSRPCSQRRSDARSSPIVFLFIGGGINSISLPERSRGNLHQRFRLIEYQRPELLKYSL